MENRFSFGDAPPRKFASGSLYRATRKEFGQLEHLSLQRIHLEPRAVREPHLHPNAAQMDYCIAGRASVGIVGPKTGRQLLDLEPGDTAFIPQGHLHWIENVGDDELEFLLVLAHEEPETIELTEMLGGVPSHVLERVLGADPALLERLPGEPVTIASG